MIKVYRPLYHSTLGSRVKKKKKKTCKGYRKWPLNFAERGGDPLFLSLSLSLFLSLARTHTYTLSLLSPPLPQMLLERGREGWWEDRCIPAQGYGRG